MSFQLNVVRLYEITTSSSSWLDILYFGLLISNFSELLFSLAVFAAAKDGQRHPLNRTKNISFLDIAFQEKYFLFLFPSVDKNIENGLIEIVHYYVVCNRVMKETHQ